MRDKRILIFSHDLSTTGAPKIKVETVYLLLKASAKEVAFSLLPELHPPGIQDALSRGDIKRAEGEMRLLMKRLLIGGEELLDRVKIIVPADIHMASRFDVIMASTMHPAMVDWITKFRESYADYNRLLWWLHEGKAGSDQLGGTKAAVDLIRSGQINALAWDSFGSQTFWFQSLQLKHKYWGEIPHPERAVQWGLLDMKRERMDRAKKDDEAKNELRKKLGIKKGDIVVVMLCSNNPIKGVAQAIEAFSKAIDDQDCRPANGDAHMIVAGSGFSAEYLREISKEHLSHVVHVLPATLHPEAILAIGHIFVSNALNGGENWGLSCIEAMSAGMAILATNGSGGLEQVQRGVNGLHHDAGALTSNVKQLQDNLCTLFKDDFLTGRMGQQSREHVVEYFNEDKMTRELGELLYYTLKRDESMSGMKKRKDEDATYIGEWTERPDMVSPTHAVEVGNTAIDDQRTGKLQAVFAIGGYKSGDVVSDTLRKWDAATAATEKWSTVRNLLPGMAQTHLAIANDGRFLFWAGGQIGPRCSPATDAVWAYDTVEDEFIAMAPLPEVRYTAEAVVVTRDNDPSLLPGEAMLHVISGFGPDRMSPMSTHWAMKIRGPHQGAGQLLAMEDQVWVDASEVLMPAGHIASFIVDHFIYLVGVLIDHAEGNNCNSVAQKWHKVYGSVQSSVYHHLPGLQRYDLIRKRWTRLADMPIPSSHACVVKHGSKVIVLGGTTETDRLISTIQEYDLEKDEWHVLNRTMPKSQFLKGGVAWLHDGRVFYSCGQSGYPDHRPSKVRKETYSATIF